jgi:hypothetical protein
MDCDICATIRVCGSAISLVSLVGWFPPRLDPAHRRGPLFFSVCFVSIIRSIDLKSGEVTGNGISAKPAQLDLGDASREIQSGLALQRNRLQFDGAI